MRFVPRLLSFLSVRLAPGVVRRGAAGILAVTLVASTGCSILFVKPAPPQQLWNRVGWAQCTQHMTWPVIDTLMAVGSAVTLVAPFLADPDSDFAGLNDSTQLTINGLQLLGWSFSAYYGYNSANMCRAFWLHQMQRRQRGGVQDPRAPGPRGYPQPGYAPQPAPGAAPPSQQAPPSQLAPQGQFAPQGQQGPAKKPAPATGTPPTSDEPPVMEPPPPSEAPPEAPNRP